MRIGLLVDEPVLAAWQRMVAGELMAAGAGADVVAIVRASDPADRQDSSITEPAPGVAASTLFALVDRFDRWIANRYRRFDAGSGDLPDVPILGVHHDQEVLARLDLLIGLDTARGPLPTGSMPSGLPQWVLALSRYALSPCAPRGFWEAARGDDTITISVSEACSGRILRQRVIGTVPLSWTAQRQLAQSLAGPMLAHALADHRRGRRSCVDEMATLLDSEPRLGMPGTGAVLAATARTLREIGGKLLSAARRTRSQWFVLLGRPSGGRWRLREFEALVPPPRRIWADPFPLVDDDANDHSEPALLVEDMAEDVGRGAIALLQRESTGWVATPVIDEPYHLSYPYLFEWEGETFMVPESEAGREISLYRMGDTAKEWCRMPALMTGVRAVDTSLLFHEGRIWMFTSFLREPDFASHYRELHLFHALTFPTTQWTPHPDNPVVCDARHARMGGGFLRHDGNLFRIAQGARLGEYGTSIELRRIVRLDTDGYVEVPAGSIAPDWAPALDGAHHMAVRGDLMVIDACRRSTRF